MQVDLLAVHANIGDDAARRDDLFTNLEGRWNPDGFDRRVYATAAGKGLHTLASLSVGAIDCVGGTELAGDA
jgi:hypothetical protein